MTWKHFDALAQMIARVTRENDYEGVKPETVLVAFTEGIIGICQKENASFDRGRFLEAIAHHLQEGDQ